MSAIKTGKEAKDCTMTSETKDIYKIVRKRGVEQNNDFHNGESLPEGESGTNCEVEIAE